MQEIGASTAVNTAPAIGPCTSCDRRNTNRNTSAIMQITNASAIKSAAAGKITSEIRSAATSTEIGATMASATMVMSVDTATATTSTTTIEVTRRFRIAALSLAATSTLLLTPVIAAEAA